MIVTSPRKASKFFEAKMEFTTGPDELNELIKSNEDITIIDVRLPEDYVKGHIPGAINLSKERWDTFTSLSKDKTNVIYCYSETCHLAAAAAWKFAQQGYPVMELEGGFEAWKQYELTIES